jgi:hypothetical protein
MKPVTLCVRKRLLAGAAAVLFGCCAPVAMAQSANELAQADQLLRFYKARADILLEGLRPELRKGLSLRELEIERGVVYQTFVNNGINAYARKQGGRSYTVFSAGLVEVIDWLSTAMAFTTMGQKTCGEKYASYLIEGIAENTARYNDRSQALRTVGTPFYFAQSEPQLCPGLTLERFQSNHNADDVREIAISACLQLVAAHELGHHIDRDADSLPASPAESRRREAAADAFAFRNLIRSGRNPMIAVPVLLLFAGIENFSLEAEDRASHPAGVRRLESMIEAAREALASEPEMLADMKKTGRYEEWQNLMSTLQAQLRQALKQ